MKLGVAVVAVTAALLVWNGLFPGPDARRANLAEALESDEPAGGGGGLDQPTPVAAAVERIAGNPGLWQPLVAPPQREEPPPDLKKILEGVQFTRRQSGDRMLIEADGGRQWVGVGGQVRGLTVRRIEPGHAQLEMQRSGKTFSITVTRQ